MQRFCRKIRFSSKYFFWYVYLAVTALSLIHVKLLITKTPMKKEDVK